MLNITAIPAFNDNYIWQLEKNNRVIWVDPGDANAVINQLKSDQTPVAILITHRHQDHIGGVNDLKLKFPDLKIIAPESPFIPLTDFVAKPDSTINIEQLGLTFKVIKSSGHTKEHVSYYSAPYLFCGDSLFSVGCGRMFDGPASDFTNTLLAYLKLPDNTLAYCTHEYTQKNIEFAEYLDPNNELLIKYKQWAREQRSNNNPTLPCVLGLEKQINPFLRLDDQKLIARVAEITSTQLDSTEAFFSKIRKMKDTF